MHTQGDLKGSPVSAQLDTDVSSTLVRSMFQGLALGGSSGQGLPQILIILFMKQLIHLNASL